MKSNCLYVFVHLHKTGGTTLNKHIAKNFKKNEVLFLYYDKLGIDPFSSKKQNYEKLAKNAVLNLSKKQREKIKIISGHFIPKDIVNYFPNKKIRYITILRDPYSRAKSFYNYFRTLYEREDKYGKDKQLYKSFLKINGKVPDFNTWIRKKYGTLKSGVVIHPMRVYFENLGYKLFDFYFIGITKNLTDDLPRIYKLLKINKFFVNQNISKNFVKNNDSKDFFENKFKKSVNIYNKALKISEEQGLTIVSGLNLKLWKVWIKIVTPFTQIIFDFVESLRLFSGFLRSKSALYNKVWDTLKKLL